MPTPTNSDSWCTPKWMTDLLPVVDLDPCSNPQSTVRVGKPGRALSLETGDDGLAEPWATVPLWMATPSGETGHQTSQAEAGNTQPVHASTASSAFVNPPYSDVMPWVKRALEFSANGGTCLMLVKADRTTKWFKAAVAGGATVMYFVKRIKFDGAEHTANFPSAFLIFGNMEFWWPFLQKLEDLGWIDL